MSRISGSLDVDPSEHEEIHALIQKAKECSLNQSKTLAHALSQQVSSTIYLIMIMFHRSLHLSVN